MKKFLHEEEKNVNYVLPSVSFKRATERREWKEYCYAKNLNKTLRLAKMFMQSWAELLTLNFLNNCGNYYKVKSIFKFWFVKIGDCSLMKLIACVSNFIKGCRTNKSDFDYFNNFFILETYWKPSTTNPDSKSPILPILFA